SSALAISRQAALGLQAGHVGRANPRLGEGASTAYRPVAEGDVRSRVRRAGGKLAGHQLCTALWQSRLARGGVPPPLVPTTANPALEKCDSTVRKRNVTVPPFHSGSSSSRCSSQWLENRPTL